MVIKTISLVVTNVRVDTKLSSLVDQISELGMINKIDVGTAQFGFMPVYFEISTITQFYKENADGIVQHPRFHIQRVTQNVETNTISNITKRIDRLESQMGEIIDRIDDLIDTDVGLSHTLDNNVEKLDSITSRVDKQNEWLGNLNIFCNNIQKCIISIDKKVSSNEKSIYDTHNLLRTHSEAIEYLNNNKRDRRVDRKERRQRNSK